LDKDEFRKKISRLAALNAAISELSSLIQGDDPTTEHVQTLSELAVDIARSLDEAA
jgi:hypothetical protein